MSGAYDVIADASEEAWGVRPRHLAWLKAFESAEGRAPRVLGIGNVSNNAFRNALALREIGVEADVLCYNYLHVMGCPEWEEARFDAASLDQFHPDWASVDLGGYERPRWFAQGQLGTALDYLISLREDGEDREDLWNRLALERDPKRSPPPPSTVYAEPWDEADAWNKAEAAAWEFSTRYPRRWDALTADEVFGLTYVMQDLPRIRRLLSHYDFIIGYATDGVFPLLAGRRDFICYEHGTIRSIPFERTRQGRLCALTYAAAADVLITNADNILAAQRMRLSSFRFIPHAILETWRAGEGAAELRRGLLDAHDADFIIFHPARHHWSPSRDAGWEKGNDLLLHAFARLVKNDRPGALLITIDWGVSVQASKDLADRLGVSDRIVWLPTLAMQAVFEYASAADVLADQFTIGAWGGILPVGAMSGTPNLIHLDAATHDWCFPSLPPTFGDNTCDGIYAGLKALLDRQVAKRAAEEARNWYDKRHSLDVVRGRLLDSFMKVWAEAFESAPLSEGALAAARGLYRRRQEPASKASAAEHIGPPDDAEVRRLHVPAEVVCYDVWASAGASVELGPAGVLIRTPPVPWHYAAGLPLDFSETEFATEEVWVRVRIADVRGAVGIGLYRASDDSLMAEARLPLGAGAQEQVLRCTYPDASLLLFRSLEAETSTSVRLLGVEVLSAPSYRASIRGASET